MSRKLKAAYLKMFATLLFSAFFILAQTVVMAEDQEPGLIRVGILNTRALAGGITTGMKRSAS